jgi:hypothetical protein
MPVEIADMVMKKGMKYKFAYFTGKDGRLILSPSTITHDELTAAKKDIGGQKLTGTTCWENDFFVLYLDNASPSKQLDEKIYKTIKKQAKKESA